MEFGQPRWLPFSHRRKIAHRYPTARRGAVLQDRVDELRNVLEQAADKLCVLSGELQRVQRIPQPAQPRPLWMRIECLAQGTTDMYAQPRCGMGIVKAKS